MTTTGRNWIHQMFVALDADGVPGLYPYLCENVVFRFGNFPPGTGREDFDRAWRRMAGHVRSMSHELLDTWERGDSAACRGNVTYSLLDGRNVTVPFANVFYLNDGKIVEYLVHVDASAVFGSAGD